MRTFQFALARSYLVEINADTAEAARFACEFYIGNPMDLSQSEERTREHFEIMGIELAYNEAHLIEASSEGLEDETKITY